MSLEEKAALMSGKDTWSTVSYKKYGIPSMVLSHGPHGLRIHAGAAGHLGLHAGLPATCFPTAATVANSWDEALAEQLGGKLGEEAAAAGVNMILGPGLNLKRSPLCGRNFEYFSEDPYLSGKMAAAYIRGIQSKGVAACPKHFAANNQECLRMSGDSIIDERTFRELYTTGFEIAVKEGKSKAIMSAYNRINGIYANENAHLLQEILVKEWGFDGVVVSDWGGSNDHVLGVQNGSHLEMPSTGKLGTRELVRAVREKRLKEEVLNQRVDELLHVIFETQQKEEDGKPSVIAVEENHAFAQKAARESIVLLKNEEQILPLKKNAVVTVLGDFAETPRYQGAGSSLVTTTKLDTALELFAESGLVLHAFEKGYERNKKTNPLLIQKAVRAAEHAEYVLLYAGLEEISESEGMDRTHMRMPQNQVDLILAAAQVNPNIIVVLSAGCAVEMPWFDKVKAVVHGYLGGQAGAGAMLEVLTGAYNPGGKLNETYPFSYEDTPAFRYFPGKERYAEYRESLYVGYRYYESVKKSVRFPFGYGLSYTTFAYRDLKITPKGVEFVLQNTGTRDGSEIAQLYAGIRSNQIFRPVRELKGFRKVFLRAGEETTVAIPFDDKTFRYFNVVTNTWEAETGSYDIAIGINANQMVLEGSLEIAGTKAPVPYVREQLPSYFSGHIENVTDLEFEQILQIPLPAHEFRINRELDKNDAICQMQYAKSLLARGIYRVLNGMKKRSEKRLKPNLNLLFIYHMPFRSLAKLTRGAVNMHMVDALVEIVNGRGLIGFAHLIAGIFKR